MAHRKLGRRWWTVVAACLVACIGSAATVPEARAAALGPRSSDGARKRGGDFHFKPIERCFMREINRRRTDRGLRRLRWDKQMGYVARQHARAMAQRGVVWHDGRLTTRLTHWRTLGQNSGRGDDCDGLSRAFWRSSGHRANILGRWRFVAVGARRRDGSLYVQQVFEYRSNPGNVWGLP